MRFFFKSRKKNDAPELKAPPSYDQDWLTTYHDASFMKEPRFNAAYSRGVQAAGEDLKCHWRVHVALWAASHSISLKGAFVECGVNRGVISSAIMQFLNWNTLDRKFYLFDTFCGLDSSVLNEEEKELKYVERFKNYYKECFEEAKQNFSEFKNTYLIRGTVPSTLSKVAIDKVAYLSIDMNCAHPEIAAANYFWPKLTPGALILLDD